jgi:hypothetical protein
MNGKLLHKHKSNTLRPLQDELVLLVQGFVAEFDSVRQPFSIRRAVRESSAVLAHDRPYTAQPAIPRSNRSYYFRVHAALYGLFDEKF